MKYLKLLLLLLLLTLKVTAQNNAADSLAGLLKNAKEDTTRVQLLLELCKVNFSDAPNLAIRYANQAKELSEKLQYGKGIAMSLKNLGLANYMKGDYIQTLGYWNQSLTAFEKIGDKPGVANLLSNLGAVYFNQGDDASALEYYLKSLKQAEELNDTLRIITTCINIGAVYFNKKATKAKALEFYFRALPLSESHGDNDAIGTVSVNIGEIYLDRMNLDSALLFFEKSLKAFEGSENLPYTLINIGKVYRYRKDFNKAILFQSQAYDYAKYLDAKNDIALSLIALGETYSENNNLKKSLEYFTEAEKLSKEIGANYQLKEAYQGLAGTYARMEDFGKAFKYQNLLLSIKDTLFNLDIEKKLGTLQFGFDLEKKESQISLLTKDKEIQDQELRRQKVVRNSFIGGFAIVLLFAATFFAQKNRIAKEKKRSDELLLNILPEETAEELKATGTAKAKSIDSVTVMFTDFKNFTQASEKLSAEELVAEINLCYSEFDRIITKHGLEKIKTIGDAYMCAGGLPVPNATHPEDVVRAGLEFQEFIAQNKMKREKEGQPFFELRLGIHTGPVVAGIVGIKKFAYDIWGDTVNTASRMESSGAVGKVNISGFTYNLIKDKFVCTHRGMIEAKNKGQIEMYFVERPV
jgi:adenylate cyclase